MPNPNEPDVKSPETGDGVDYKALYEQAQEQLKVAQEDVEKWKTQSRKNESRAKNNAGAAKSLEELSQQMAELTEQFTAMQGENATLKAQAARAALVSKVAESTGVPEGIVSALAANDEDSLTAAATAIAEAYKVPGGAPLVPEAGVRVNTGGSGKTKQQQFGDMIAEALGAK